MKSVQPTLSGHYRMVAVNADNGEQRVLADWFENQITDNGLDLIGTGGAIAVTVVGSGSTPPSASNTQMQTFVAQVGGQPYSVTGGVSSAAPFYRYTRVTRRFAAGVAAGNLSEVGVGASSTSLFSRSLIKDSSGNPTTITVLSNEFLDVVYEVRVYAPTADITGQIVIGGVTHDYVMRAAMASSDTGDFAGAWANPNLNYGVRLYGCSAYRGAIGSETNQPQFELGGGITADASYGAGNHYRDSSVQFGLDTANHQDGISAIMFRTDLGYFQCSFNPPVAKDSSKQFSINTRMSWTRRA